MSEKLQSLRAYFGAGLNEQSNPKDKKTTADMSVRSGIQFFVPLLLRRAIHQMAKQANFPDATAYIIHCIAEDFKRRGVDFNRESDGE